MLLKFVSFVLTQCHRIAGTVLVSIHRRGIKHVVLTLEIPAGAQGECHRLVWDRVSSCVGHDGDPCLFVERRL